jgi:carboxymethylenebutenolidase
MIAKTIDVRTTAGSMNTYITHPEDGGPFPVVIVLMDLFGLRPELFDLANRLAASGYYVMVPNLYYRRVHEFDFKTANPPAMFEHMHSLSNDRVCEDIGSLIEFSGTDKIAKNGSVGCVGYCMSGPFAFAAAAAFPDQIAAAASFHGVRLCTEAADSPHLNADKIKGEIYFGCAEKDDFAPQEMIDSLDKHLAETGINYRIEVYPGTGHGFVFKTRPEGYHQSSDERHWQRMLDLFERNLG